MARIAFFSPILLTRRQYLLDIRVCRHLDDAQALSQSIARSALLP
ncbi:MAG: hypothetical protein ABSC17_11135 [Thermacetogeniaceae bacterium]